MASFCKHIVVGQELEMSSYFFELMRFFLTARTSDSMGRVFLSRCGARVNSQGQGQSQVHMFKQLNWEE